MIMSWRSDFRFARFGAVLLAVCSFGVASGVCAQELEPRSYTNTPVGMSFLLAGYGYATGSAAANPSVPLENANLQAHAGILGYARALDVWGTSGKLSVILPYAGLSGSAELSGQSHERDVTGLGDPSLQFSVNLYGAPALSLEEFRHYQQDLIIGASLKVVVPVGQYDNTKLVNIGTNRWTIRPELGISKAVGRWTVEVTAAAAFYTDNNDFLGGQTRSQDPLYSMQTHVIYGFESGVWTSVDGTWYTGGRASVDGVEDPDRQNNTRLGVTVALPVDRYNSVKLFGSTAVTTSAGGDFDAVGVAWQVRWGGGL
jgi:hypothetical protein